MDLSHPNLHTPISVPEVDRAIQAGILGTKIFSAAACIGAKEGIPFHRAVYGSLSGIPPTSKSSFQTLFDLSSLTKPLATGLAILHLVSKGRLTLDAPVSRLLKDFRAPYWNKILIEDLLDHTSGLAPHKPYWEMLKNEQIKEPSKPLLTTEAGALRIRALIEQTAPQTERHTLSIYSDINFIILGYVVEAVTQKRLNHFIQKELYEPLGLSQLFYVDLSDQKRSFVKREFSATEQCSWRNKLLVGEVHDPNAWAMGGIAGHAGLFGTLDHVFYLGQMLLDSYLGKSNAPFHTATVRRFFTKSKRTCNKTWALGWDTPSAQGSLAGTRMSRNSVGHLGFTGCSIWLDLQRDHISVVLTNRAHPTPQGKDDWMRKFRPHTEDLLSAYAQSWTPPVIEVEEDPYAKAKLLQAQKNKQKNTAMLGKPPSDSVKIKK